MKSVKAPKWTVGAKPKYSAVNVAREIMAQRMEVVWHYLNLAASRPEEDIEYVHQLRVATRRAAAACRVFEGLARKRHLRKLTSQLRRLRRSAGMARDLDVLCERLQQEAAGDSESDVNAQHHLVEAVALVRQWRQQAQKPLIKASRQWKCGNRRKKTRRLIDRGLWRKSQKKQRFGDVSHRVLASVVNEFFDAASADLSDMEALHEVRIQGKRLRYTIELVASAFDKSLREKLYPDFEEVQERIGVVNDHVTAHQLFTDRYRQAQEEQFADAFRRLAETEEKLIQESHQQFMAWWTPKRVKQLRRRFREVLGAKQRDGKKRGSTSPRVVDAEEAELMSATV